MLGLLPVVTAETLEEEDTKIQTDEDYFVKALEKMERENPDFADFFKAYSGVFKKNTREFFLYTISIMYLFLSRQAEKDVAEYTNTALQ